jgi:hypothetical protein
MTEQNWPNEDEAELKRLKTTVDHPHIAECIQLPDKRWIKPHKDYNHYELHLTEHTQMTVVNSFYFKSLEAMMEAVTYVETLLGINEPEDSKIAPEDPPKAGDDGEEPEENLVRDPADRKKKIPT